MSVRLIHPANVAQLSHARCWLRRAVLGIAILLVFRVLFAEPYQVFATSMSPTLQPGEIIVVDKQIYEWRSPRRWEIVVFHGPEYRTTPYVKRIVGMPGETVEIKDGRIHINGDVMAMPHLAVYVAHGRHGVNSPCRLADDEFFVLGDNSAASDDSRTWPQPGVKMSAIIGKLMRH